MPSAPIRVLHLYTAQAHNFFGHHGQEPDDFPMQEHEEIQCLAGRGILGDRFLDFRSNYKGQITFFSAEVFRSLSTALQTHHHPPAVLRRNVVTEGIDLNTLINLEFTIQGILFKGSAECSPCYWMDRAFAPGAEQFLQGRGGLRARILTSGTLRRDPPGLAH